MYAVNVYYIRDIFLIGLLFSRHSEFLWTYFIKRGIPSSPNKMNAEMDKLLKFMTLIGDLKV